MGLKPRPRRPHWVDTQGPPVAMPLSKVAAWHDAERASTVRDFVATIDVGGSDALVFGDLAITTTCIDIEGGVVFVRLADSGDGRRYLLPRGVEDEVAWAPTDIRVTVRERDWVLFDSSDPETTDRCKIELEPGTYAADVGTFDHARYSLWLVRLLRL